MVRLGRLRALKARRIVSLAGVGTVCAVLTDEAMTLFRTGICTAWNVAMLGSIVAALIWLIGEQAPRAMALELRIRAAKLREAMDLEELDQRVALLGQLRLEADSLTRLAHGLDEEAAQARHELAIVQNRMDDLAAGLEPDIMAAHAVVDEYERVSIRAVQIERSALIERATAFVKSRRAPAATALTSFAATLAGRRRGWLRDAWLADLAGAPEAGIVPSDGQRLLLALGNLAAAVKMRGHDLGAPVWKPVEWLVSAEKRLNAFVTLVVGSGAVYFDVTEGLRVLLLDRSAPLSILGGSIYGLARWARRLRGIELAAPPQPDEKP